MIDVIPLEKLDNILDRFKFIEIKLSQNISSDQLKVLGQEYSDLKPVVERILEFKNILNSIEESKKLLEEQEFKDLAKDEILKLEKNKEKCKKKLLIDLIPKDKTDEKAVILEIRSGSGGSEASLFVQDLVRMYQRFSDFWKWKFEIIEKSLTDVGGLREITINISGKSVYSKLKFESGVHRVQRVPETESSGRVHTSAATVAVLPEAEEFEIEINSNDLRIDTMRSSGAGGQHVNTTDSAVRITHIPTGIVVTSSEKSQHQNRARAMQVLRSRLLNKFKNEKDVERAEKRKSMVGSGDRSERIRTYNFSQGRVTDHRINLTLYKLEEILNGDLNLLTETLIVSDNTEKILEFLNK